MSEHEQIADILDAAADVIERDGWHRDGDYAPDGTENGVTTTGLPVCVLGAMAQAVGRPKVWDEACEAWAGRGADDSTAAIVLAQHIGDYGSVYRIPAWNDAPERTEQQVLDALRSAAKAERRLADTEAAS